MEGGPKDSGPGPDWEDEEESPAPREREGEIGPGVARGEGGVGPGPATGGCEAPGVGRPGLVWGMMKRQRGGTWSLRGSKGRTGVGVTGPGPYLEGGVRSCLGEG